MQGETDSQKVLQYMRKMMNPYSGNPIFYTITYSNFNSNDNFYYQSAARGFMTYHTITDDDIELNKALLIRNGAVGLLTNSMWCARDWHTEIATMDSTISLLPGKALNTTYTVDCIDQYNKDANCGFVQLSGPELTYSEEAGGYVAPDGATGDAVVVYYYDGTAPGETEAGNATYRIYSAPVTVKLGSAVAEFLGGQIRGEVAADKPTALRFGFSLPCDGVVHKDISMSYDRDITNATIVMDGKEYTLVDFGAIVSIEKGIEISMETAITNPKVVKKVPAQRLYYVSDDMVKYTAVVTNVPVNRKNTLIYARSYVTYKEIDGDQEITVYGDVQSRSVNQVLATTKIGY